jgi:hypothetical protein
MVCLGFALPDNFRFPYAAVGFSDFWRRWHISLSSWLRDYLYIPLGGNRRGHRRTQVNLLLTMLLGGLWHGAAWRFVVWGGLHGLYLTAERYLRGVAGGWRWPSRPAGQVILAAATFALVSLAWVFFRAQSLADASHLVLAMTAGAPDRLGTGLQQAVTVVAVLALLVASHWWLRDSSLEEKWSRLPIWTRPLILAAIVLMLAFVPVTTVRSSTSSSDERLPVERWGRAWGSAAALAGLLLAGYEGYLRWIGMTPSVASREAVSVLARQRLRDASTVAVGSSRILALVDPGTWARVYGGPRLVELAALGAASIPALEHLADIPSFRGLVLADVVPFWGFTNRWLPSALTAELGAYRRAQVSPAQRAEAYSRVHVSSLLAIRRPQASPPRVLRQLATGRSLVASPSVVYPNGYAPLRFRAVGTPANAPRIMSEASFVERHPSVPTDEELGQIFERLFSAIRRIESRGGRVVLVYLPGCGGRRAMEERFFPKQRFWDPIVARSPSRAIDLDDLPGYDRLPCFDGSHLDVEDAAAATAWLAEQVRRQLADRSADGASGAAGSPASGSPPDVQEGSGPLGPRSPWRSSPWSSSVR